MQQAGIVGAGMMGREIALVFALAGTEVALYDADASALTEARAAQEKRLAKLQEKGVVSAEAAVAAAALIAPVAQLADLAPSDIVVEAVFEDLSVKESVWADLEPLLGSHCILASNTSSLPITRMAATLPEARRGTFIGMHFSSPATEMGLCEIIPGLETSAETVARTEALARALGKTPTFSRDVPGFVINRLLFAMLAEAQRLVEEGVASPADIDAACQLGLNHPVGPFKIMDHIGTDLTRQIQSVLFEAYGPRFQLSNALVSLTDAGWYGKQGAKGWRDYPIGPVRT